MPLTAPHPTASLPPGSLSASLDATRSIPSKLVIHITPCSTSTCLPCLFLLGSGLNWPPTHQTPSGSAAETLCSKKPQLGSLACRCHFSTSNRSLPLPGCSSSLASPPLSLLKTHLLQVATPTTIISALFPEAGFFFPVNQEFTVRICLFENMPSSSLCRFCTSP